MEQAIENLELTETYQLKKEEYSVVFYEENNEKLYISYYTWHGEVVDNTLENAYGSLIFIKNIGGNTIECSYGINNGKIINKTYEVKIINNTTEIITHDKITAYFFDEQISSNNIEGYFNKISFTTDSVELTVTLKSKTGKDEAYSYTLPAAYSADNLCDLGPFEFIASGTEKTMTAVYKNNSSSWHNDYFNMSLFFDRLIKGTLSQGGLHSRLNPSR